MDNTDVFVGCHGRKAAYRVNLRSYVAAAPEGRACFTRLSGDLLLCHSCTGFWLDHLGVRDFATLEKAVLRREARVMTV